MLIGYKKIFNIKKKKISLLTEVGGKECTQYELISKDDYVIAKLKSELWRTYRIKKYHAITLFQYIVLKNIIYIYIDKIYNLLWQNFILIYIHFSV